MQKEIETAADSLFLNSRGIAFVLNPPEILRINNKQEWRDRYSSYDSQPDSLAGKALEQFTQTAIQSAHTQKLVQDKQLQELKQVLKWPTDREPPEGVY